AVLAVAFGIDDLAFIERDVGQMHVRFNDEQARHLSIFNHLDGVKDADVTEISGESDVGADLLWRTVAVGGKIGAAGASNGLEARCDGNARIKELCLLEPIVSQVKLFASDVKRDE